MLCGGMPLQAGISGITTELTLISGISGMKSERFVAGQLWIERKRNREGPPISYIVMKGLSSMGFTDKKEVLRFIRWPKGTPTGDSVREWLSSFNDSTETHAPGPDIAQVAKEGFGPEAH
jgi:hypothetical protein